MLNVLDLFSGIGGISLGLERTGGFRTVAFCEIEPYPVAVLNERWPGVPVFGDVRTLSGAALRDAGIGRIDIICGGFPCQPFSVAGKQRGQADERHLWPEYARLIRELRPTWVLAENVPGLRTIAADEVLKDLEEADYSAWPLVVGADDVGAPHRRKRVWIVAHRNRLRRDGDGRNSETEPGGDWPEDGVSGTDGYVADRADLFRDGRDDQSGREVPESGDCCGEGGGVAYASGSRLEGQRHGGGIAGQAHSKLTGSSAYRWPSRPGEPQHEWEPPRVIAAQPGLGGGADGLPDRLVSRIRRERLRALGNSVVSQVVQAIGQAILAVEGKAHGTV